MVSSWMVLEMEESQKTWEFVLRMLEFEGLLVLVAFLASSWLVSEMEVSQGEWEFQGLVLGVWELGGMEEMHMEPVP